MISRLLIARHLRRGLTVLLALAPCADLGAQVHVPGDFPTIQDALDAVPDGAIIIVHGGIHGSIHIDRPVTLLGDPMPVIRTSCCEPFSEIELPAIRLDGPGHGSVVLQRVATQGKVQDGFETAGGAGITGGGFDELLVLHADIAGSDGASAFGGGQLPGGPGIDVSVPYVMVTDSTVRGGSSNYPDDPQSTLDGTAGLRAPGASVAVLDSHVSGGGIGHVTFGFTAACPTCSQILGGEGGTGVLAGTLFTAHSTIEGGAGAECFCFAGTFTPICTKPAGAALLVDALQDLSGELSATTPFEIGESSTLQWSARGAPAMLLVAFGTQVPEEHPGLGLLFLDPARAAFVMLDSGAALSEIVRIPPDATLVGLIATLQLFDPAVGLGPPVIAAFVP
ncbi:MAG TPA: hypothetical protein VK824_10965 [Planctomycetota bacterium]|nr:hypothetical protein [Planctomycetota bacterium]